MSRREKAMGDIGDQMHPKTPWLLWNMLDAGSAIPVWIEGVTFEEFERNDLMRSAVERKLGVIGDAASRLSSLDPERAAALPGLPAVLRFRNELADGHNRADSATVWAAVERTLPALMAQIERRLAEIPDPDAGACDAERQPGVMIARVQDNVAAIRALCAEYGVVRLEVFGSAATGAFDPEHSDVDFLVEYPPKYEFGPWMTRYFEFQERLVAVLACPVDLIMAGAMRNPYVIRSANASRRLLYAVNDESLLNVAESYVDAD